jgi:hypothetical protein
MLILNLTRGKSTIRAPLRLPATPGDVGEVYAKLDEVCGMMKEYQTQRGGAFTPEGYTLRRNLAEALAPQQKWWDPIFRVLLQTPDRWSRGFPPYALELPARESQLRDAQDELQVQDLEEAELVQAECVYEPIKPCIPLTDPEFSLLRDLSVNLSAAMDSFGKNLVLAVYEAKRPCSLEEAGTLASAVEQYELVTDVEEYGWNSLYELCGDEELLDTVDGYMDWYAFGLHMIEEDGLIPTGQGYVRHLQPDEQPDMGQIMGMTM